MKETFLIFAQILAFYLVKKIWHPGADFREADASCKEEIYQIDDLRFLKSWFHLENQTMLSKLFNRTTYECSKLIIMNKIS